MSISIKRVLLLTDFSDYSAIATKYAREFCARFDAELHVVHVLETHLPTTPDFIMGLDIPRFVKETRTMAEKAMAEITDSSGSQVVRTILDGSPKTEIVRYARQENIDLIVLSTHGRTGLAHVLMGSVSESIVRTAPCPVLTVRPEGHQFVMP